MSVKRQDFVVGILLLEYPEGALTSRAHEPTLRKNYRLNHKRSDSSIVVSRISSHSVVGPQDLLDLCPDFILDFFFGL
jgi:hypothetical protein